MAKMDQVIRVVLERDSDERAVLVLMRKGGDFYSTIAGSKGHRSHHKSGQVHTNQGKWGVKDYYTNRRLKTPPIEVEGTQVIQAYIFRNNQSLHFGDKSLKKYSGKKANIILRVPADEVGADSGIAVFTGFTSNPELTKKEWFDLATNEFLQLFKYELALNPNGPSIFVVVLKSLEEVNEIPLTRYLKDILKTSKLTMPSKGERWIWEGDSFMCPITITLTDGGFGPPPKPMNALPPLLKVIEEDWMNRHEKELLYRPLDGAITTIGPLTLELSPHSSIIIQPIRVSLVNFILPRKNQPSSSFIIKMSTFEFLFQYGACKGHYVKQFEIFGQKFQLSLTSVVQRRLMPDKTQVESGSEGGEWYNKHSYELVELTHKSS